MTGEAVRWTAADEWIGKYWCGCGNPEAAAEALKQVFSIFVKRWEGEPGECYFIDLKLSENLDRLNERGVLHLILYLLDGSGILTHNGSVISSSYLTPLGEEVRERLLAGEMGDDDE